MNIILPQSRVPLPNSALEGYNSIVVVGANGSGKSRFGNELVRLNSNATMLSLLQAFSSIDKLVESLMAEEIRVALEYKESSRRSPHCTGSRETKLDKIREIWTRLLPYTTLVVEDSRLKLNPSQDSTDSLSYEISHMSEGEKIIFYLLGVTLTAPENSIIVVDEPELHLGRTLLSQVWDEIERCRPDSMFVYLTHDISFTSSRSNSRKIWIKSINSSSLAWDYGVIDTIDTFPEEIYLEMLGSRKPILFIEGTDKFSIDSKLYPLIFPDFTVKPLGSCTKVIDTTKAFAEQRRFHLLDSYGIVDRDRRTDSEVDSLRRKNIFVPDVAEVENLLMMEPVIRAVARRMLYDENAIFAEIKRNVVQLFHEEIEYQALLHTRHQVRRKIELMIDRRVESIDELSLHISTLTDGLDTTSMWSSICEQFAVYVANEDYNSILRVYNQKGMMSRSRLFQLCGFSNKDRYLNYILSLLKENKLESDQIRIAIKTSLGVL
ncbi:MAG: DUF4435 domain-containing protein [Bacteroidales bacterium]